MDEHQMTISALYIQKSELQLKLQNFETKVRKLINQRSLAKPQRNDSDEQLTKKVSFTTRDVQQTPQSICMNCAGTETMTRRSQF